MDIDEQEWNKVSVESESFKLGRAFLNEAEIDFKVCKILEKYRTKEIKRRRLFFLQQALEKAVKSTFLVYEQSLVTLLVMPSLALMTEGPDATSDKAFNLILEIVSKLVGSNEDLKQLQHNPARALNLKKSLEDIYLHLKRIDTEGHLAKQVLTSRQAFDTKDLKEILNGVNSQHDWKIKELVHELAIANRKHKKNEAVDSRLSKMVFGGFLTPVMINSFWYVMSHLILLDYLADFEQASRYPEKKQIPDELMQNLDALQLAVGRLIKSAEDYYSDDIVQLLYAKG